VTSSGELVGSNGETTLSKIFPVVPEDDGEEESLDVKPLKKSVNERFVENDEVKGSCLVFSGVVVVLANS